MRALNNLDYHYLSSELNARLSGVFLNNIYSTDVGLRFKFKGRTEFNLMLVPGKYAYLADSIPESVEMAPFVRLLRDQVENARVLRVHQMGFDRVIALDLEKRTAYTLVFEMFGDGNAVLCTSEGKIVDALTRIAHGSRVLAPGKTYALPPNSKKPPSEVTAESLIGLTGKIVSVLSKHVNLAPYYLEEACRRCSIDLSRTAESLSDAQRKHLATEIAALAQQPLQPVVYYSGTDAVDFAPFPLLKTPAESPQPYPSFSQALAAYFSSAKPAAAEDAILKGLRHTLQEQQAALVSLDAQEKELRAKGDAILANYPQVLETLGKAKTDRQKKVDFKLSED